MRVAGLLIAVAATLAVAPAPLLAQEESPGEQLEASPVALVVDVSGSMSESDGTGRIKINGAKQALLDFLGGVEAGTPIGLRTYPEHPGGSCNTGEELFPISPRDPSTMSATIRTLRPNGDTPTAEALRAAADDLLTTGAASGTIILLSDGESTCGNPCTAAKRIAAEGIELEAITIGFRVSAAGRRELECVADATGGSYLDADDNEGLEDALSGIASPVLSIELGYPSEEVVPEVGNGPDGLVHIAATVTNEGKRPAINAKTRLRFDGFSPGVVRPVRFLGNLEPGQSREVDWTFRPSLLLAGRTTRFVGIAGADNAPRDAIARGAIGFSDDVDAADAGPILRDHPRIAILGDSYSSGEGADEYLAGTATRESPCHRSPLTYLVPEFDLSDGSVIACSGAISNDIAFPQDGRRVNSQIQQVADLQEAEGVDAVILTLAGNDAEFGSIVWKCLGFTCGEDDLPDESFFEDDLPSHLVSAYQFINSAVNGDDDVAARGGLAPVIVLGYPLPTPYTRQQCPTLIDRTVDPPFMDPFVVGLDADEVDLISGFLIELNGSVEGAVEIARERGVPAFYVPNTEPAFQPDHTVCDEDPYVRGLTSLNGAGLDELAIDVAKAAGFPVRPGAVQNVFKDAGQSVQELVHPNPLGYRALSRAAIRWSLGREGQAADATLRDMDADAGDPPQARRSGVQLAASSSDDVQVDPGTIYPLIGDGFAPGSPVTVTMFSSPRVLAVTRADQGGGVASDVGIPLDIPDGDHEIVLSGIDPGGAERSLRIPVTVPGDGLPAVVVAISATAGALALVAGALALASWVASRTARRRSARG